MKLTRKLTLALILGILVVLVVNAALRVRREIALFERDSKGDSLLVGRMLAGSVKRVWSSLGEAEVMDLVEDANQRESSVRIRWVWLNEPVEEPDFPARIPVVFDRARVVENEPIQILSAASGHDALYTYVPVGVPDGRIGAIEVRDTLVDQRLYVRRTVQQAMLTTLILVLLCGAIAVGLGFLLVGKPFRCLIEQARRIGRGDLSMRLSLLQKDEVGELASEMNTMCDLLADARETAIRESTERIKALEQLRHADRLSTVGQLAAGIAHELGTPLNVIMGRAQLVLKRHVAQDDTYKHSAIVLEQAKKMTAIVRKLLDFARRRGTQKSPQRLHQLAQQTLSMLAPLAEKAKVRFSLTGDEDLVADVDAGQLQQALTNLIVNGLQAMDEGGILEVSIGRPKPPETATPNGNGRTLLAIAVRDQGVGIPAGLERRLFEPFFTTKPAGEGTGLGLSVAYGIVEEHGGFIEVESEFGAGSSFTIYIPERKE
jgi:signal transduction histidine kinase